jgi:adenosylmethionine-8-amino-7-oxononanoate aminotransferase
VTDARQAGTIAAIELRVGDGGYLAALGPKLQSFYLEHGVLLRPLGNVVYVMPPYCTTAAELDRIYNVIEESLGLVR